MYKQYTAQDFKKDMNLPEDYKVDGLICHGTMRKKRHDSELLALIEQSGHPISYKPVIESGFFENVKELKYNNKTIWFDTCYGGAYTSELVHVASLLGSKKNLLIGSCGGLYPEGEAGDLIIPKASFGNESSTRMYQPENKEYLYFSSQQLNQSLKKRLETFTIHEGNLITCQGALAESWEDIERWSKEGYFGVEMESSTFFAVSQYFDVPASALILIADNIIKKETVLDESFQEIRQKLTDVRTQIFLTALEEVFS